MHGASWGPFQAGARGKMPQLPPPVGGPGPSLSIRGLNILESRLGICTNHVPSIWLCADSCFHI